MDVSIFPTIQEAPSTSEIQYGWEVTKMIVSVLLGVLISFGSFWLSNWYTNKKRYEKETVSYLNLLYATCTEVKLYIGKLRILKDDLAKFIEALESGKSTVVPSYSIYPNLLEKSKSEIMSFHRNADLIEQVSKCHYELCHVLERLNKFKNPKQGDALIALNAQGFMDLVENCFSKFETLNTNIKEQMNEIRSQEPWLKSKYCKLCCDINNL